MRQPMIPSMTRLSCGTIRCQINGTYVPVAEFELAAGDWIYFSPKVLLWTDPATTLTIPQPSRGRRTGMMEAHGPGHIGVAENRAGEVIALPLRRAQQACVHPGRFLCATGNVKYQWRPSGVSYITMAAEREYPAGRYQLSLTAAGRQGLVLLHASGDAFLRDLADSESVLVSPASLLYWEDTVDLSLHLEFPYVPGQHVRRVFWRSSRSGCGSAARDGWSSTRPADQPRTPAKPIVSLSPHSSAGMLLPPRRRRRNKPVPLPLPPPVQQPRPDPTVCTRPGPRRTSSSASEA